MNQIQQEQHNIGKPYYKEIERGVGIKANEFEAIINISSEVYQSGQFPLSKLFSDKLKQALGGEWFIFIYPLVEDKTYDYTMTCADSMNSVSFIIEQTKFQIFHIIQH